MAGVWAIDGVEVPASVARMLAYVAGGGAEGIVEPGGLKVLPLAVPGTSVRVLPGAAMVKNLYPGGSLQSYPVYETVQQTVPIVATGSGGGRTDLVIARVRDTEYAAGPPGMTFEVIQGVPSNTTADYVSALPYPALALARVTLPASTATVSAAMITDLRRLAQPRSLRRVRQSAPQSTPQNMVHDGAVLARWITPAEWQVEIPAWATHVNIRLDVFNAIHLAGNVFGNIGAFVAGAQAVTAPYAAAWVGASTRAHAHAVGEYAIPPALAGTTQTFDLRGNRLVTTGHLQADSQTVVALDLEFTERTV